MFHGVPRTTVDIDIIASIKEDDIHSFVDYLNSQGFAASAQDMKAALWEQSRCTVFFGNSLLRLDIYGLNSRFDKLTLERAIDVELFGTSVKLGSRSLYVGQTWTPESCPPR